MTQFPWLAKYDTGVPKSLIYPESPIQSILEGAAKRAPDRIAIEFLGLTMNYASLLENARRFANSLEAMGVKKGDRVAIMLPNCPQFIIAFFGSMMLGAVVVNTSPLYVARELEQQLRDSGAETLIMLNLFYPRYREIAASVPVKRVIMSTVADFLPFPKNMLYPVKAKRDGTWVEVKPEPFIVQFKKLLEKSVPSAAPKTNVLPDDLALLQYTGGTTGTPKGAMLTHRNLMSNLTSAASWTPTMRDAKEITLCAIPFFHVYGMTVAMNMTIRAAGTMVLLPRFQIKDVLEAIHKQKPTMFPGVPTMYVALNNHPDIKKYDLSSLQICLSGAAALPIEVAHTFELHCAGGKLIEGYGLTECSPCATNTPVNGERRDGSIGIPLPGVELALLTENLEPVQKGEIGEIAISGHNVMQGYWQRPEESSKSIKEIGGKRWLLTGDMAKMDDDGYFYIVDRKKDMIDASGYNVYPREVEEVLYKHLAIQECVVVGVPDEYRGETVKAFIILRQGSSATADEITAFCKGQLAAYKVPKQIEFRLELPKSPIGKILRRVLRDEEEAKHKV
jgi:long-chain acyl-CoA synthetase